jgi:hypothetical protein
MPPLMYLPFAFQFSGLPFPSHAADKIQVLSSAMSVVAGLFPWCRLRKCRRRSQKIHKRISVAMPLTSVRLGCRTLRSRCVASIADKSTGNFLIHRGDSSACLTRGCRSFAKDFFRAIIAAMPVMYGFQGPAGACGLSRFADVHFYARNLT